MCFPLQDYWPHGFFLHSSHAKWQPVTVNLCSQPVKRHAKIWPARQKTDDVKIGCQMKGWTQIQETIAQQGSLKLKRQWLDG